jgi:hypothetical protein
MAAFTITKVSVRATVVVIMIKVFPGTRASLWTLKRSLDSRKPHALGANDPSITFSRHTPHHTTGIAKSGLCQPYPRNAAASQDRPRTGLPCEFSLQALHADQLTRGETGC